MMPYAGKTLMARNLAREARRHWRNYELTKALATPIAESHLSVGAWHDNLGVGGKVSSRDCGLYQINIPASQIGTPYEAALRTESNDPTIYTPVVTYNVYRALDLYNSPWTRDGSPDIRRWQPWVAYTTGWATFPFAWVWHRDADGNDVGPWVPTGRYIFKAIAGQMNNLVVNEKEWTPEKALEYAGKYAAHFAISDGSVPVLAVDGLGNRVVSWKFAPKPIDPPAPGESIYPTPNNGV